MSRTKSLTERLGKTGETLGETLSETFRAKESRQEFCRESRIERKLVTFTILMDSVLKNVFFTCLYDTQ